ncbi:hypothetical protein SEMRO_3630_G349830.1 [Seminavis robusta]|uniref:Uncharacterized protein n=1 Tax=Seminavis robusta TaxID=568900 RepID=A0A9N8I0B1_9STRA|nr:hypothetical protein SEMRO_3630_G349830.1 [Seminavis robusta]|eukprot:Sro3630_g349830.1 n/a (96) ;mRNA; r:4299-4586
MERILGATGRGLTSPRTPRPAHWQPNAAIESARLASREGDWHLAGGTGTTITSSRTRNGGRATGGAGMEGRQLFDAEDGAEEEKKDDEADEQNEE